MVIGMGRYLLKATSGSELDLALSEQEDEKPSHPFFGLLLSVASALLVGGSFILQKKGLIRSTAQLSHKGK